MTTTCTDTGLTRDVWKDKEDLDMRLRTDDDFSSVKIDYRPDGTSGYETATLSVAETWVILEWKDDGYTWTIEYTSVASGEGIWITVCKTVTSPDDDLCSDHETQAECEDAGCYWYEDACHSRAQSAPGEDLTDYDRIESGVEGLLSPIISSINDIYDAINGVIEDIQSLGANLSTQVSGGIDSLGSRVDGLAAGLSNLIDSVYNEMTEGFTGVREMIEGLEFPTIDSIKQAFLDTCAELSIALWESILDRIEARYPDDEEEE